VVRGLFLREKGQRTVCGSLSTRALFSPLWSGTESLIRDRNTLSVPRTEELDLKYKSISLEREHARAWRRVRRSRKGPNPNFRSSAEQGNDCDLRSLIVIMTIAIIMIERISQFLRGAQDLLPVSVFGRRRVCLDDRPDPSWTGGVASMDQIPLSRE